MSFNIILVSLDQRVQKAYNIIKTRYKEDLSLGTLAEEVGLSEFHFQRLFKEELTESPFECLNRIRLQRAAHLITLNPDLEITEAGFECGFSSLTAFSRSFKKHFGLSPSSYRALKHNNRTAPNADENFSALNYEDPAVSYFKGSWVLFRHTSVFNDHFLNDFESTRAWSMSEGIPGITEENYGIYNHIHMAFKKNGDQLNYYAGVRLKKKPDAKYQLRTFYIPEGRYASFITNNSYNDLFNLIVKFKSAWLDKHSYKLKKIFAFEHVFNRNTPDDYPFLERRIYLPVR